MVGRGLFNLFVACSSQARGISRLPPKAAAVRNSPVRRNLSIARFVLHEGLHQGGPHARQVPPLPRPDSRVSQSYSSSRAARFCRTGRT
ncbi:MAG: hypothetical protein MZU84_01920 [Sphingobacterium sp.]|nr:hypothetical protein [Sphingobacterium sp.]